jgi:hypothetical protein
MFSTLLLEDCKKLYRDYGVSVRNCVELALLARSVDNATWKGKYSHPLGLTRLLENYKGLTLEGKGKIQRSNWEAWLSEKQQDCKAASSPRGPALTHNLLDAANDAQAGLAIYQHLLGLLGAMETPPLLEYYSFDCIEGIAVQPSTFIPGSTIPWQPQNPQYDPGPMPEKKDKETKQKEKAERRQRQETQPAGQSDDLDSPGNDIIAQSILGNINLTGTRGTQAQEPRMEYAASAVMPGPIAGPSQVHELRRQDNIVQLAERGRVRGLGRGRGRGRGRGNGDSSQGRMVMAENMAETLGRGIDRRRGSAHDMRGDTVTTGERSEGGEPIRGRYGNRKARGGRGGGGWRAREGRGRGAANQGASAPTESLPSLFS